MLPPGATSNKGRGKIDVIDVIDYAPRAQEDGSGKGCHVIVSGFTHFLSHSLQQGNPFPC